MKKVATLEFNGYLFDLQYIHANTTLFFIALL